MMRNKKQTTYRPCTEASIAQRLDELRRKGVISLPSSDAKRGFKSLVKKPGALRRFLDSR
jgi:hypothetical protein